MPCASSAWSIVAKVSALGDASGVRRRALLNGQQALVITLDSRLVARLHYKGAASGGHVMRAERRVEIARRTVAFINGLAA